MKFKIPLISFVSAYLLFCGFLVVDSGIFKNTANHKPCILLQNTTETTETQPTDTNEPVKETTISQALPEIVLGAKNAEPVTVTIGAENPNTENPLTGFKLQLKLNSRGASIEKVTFSNGPDEEGKRHGFDDRDPNSPQPFVLLRPVRFKDGREILSMSNNEFVFVDREKQLPLNKLNWKFEGVEKIGSDNEKAAFSAIIIDQADSSGIIKLTKTFTIKPDSYMVDCDINVENLTQSEHGIRFNLTGPVGTNREDVRSDMRKATAAFKVSEDDIVSKELKYSKLRKATSQGDLVLDNQEGNLLWAAISNKYFASIVVPVPEEGKEFCDWITGKIDKDGKRKIVERDKKGIFSGISKLFGSQIEKEKITLTGKYGQFYNPDGIDNNHDETIGLKLDVDYVKLAPKGNQNSLKTYKFNLYLGPKDKSLFDSREYYKKLGFFHTMDFMACCCPKGIIQPLAFFVMWLMNALFIYIPNYGVVIIILVFIVRVLLHPLTKAGQTRMNRFTKILSSPEVLEIRKKYGKNHLEMQKRISAFQKEKGVSPIDMFLGMMPTMAQMPIWIALWTSVNSSVNLRGAGFLPFWITDLSVPDALITWPAVTVPLLGWQIDSFNLLPILMGVAFYMQQKMMPQQAAATPEQQQQQKMMKIMMLLLFPLMLYKAPSGVSLYIMASSFAGAIEQYVIRKHIREKEEQQSRGLVEVTSKTGGKVKKKKPKPFIKY